MCCDGKALAATLAAHNSSGIDSKTACEETEGDADCDKPLRSSGGTRQRRVWRSMCATETRRTQLHCKMYEATSGIDLLIKFCEERASNFFFFTSYTSFLEIDSYEKQRI